jgi:hypothetical protein
MKLNVPTSCYNIKRTLLFIVFLLLNLLVLSKAQQAAKYPFSTDSTHLTIWNGSEYVPFFIKGINLGIAVPGTFPGEMAATRNDYSRWLSQIQQAGFNCIRLYTLHYPRFYEVLDSFNIANKQHPLLFFQGVWLEEELTSYTNNLYSLSNIFNKEIEDDIDCVHGNSNIPQRVGKAYGSYSADVSPWCLGYIVGREVFPAEVLKTNKANSAVTTFAGKHFTIQNASPTEAWLTSNLDHTVDYESTKYKTQRSVSISSWPTLDPLRHLLEAVRQEDTASVDLSKVKILDAPAGMFISYHAYPYYPDFISQQPSYQPSYDEYGSNSYQGYLTELKAHYPQFPLIIAEYGVPSSWEIAHYASSGMNHGGFDEYHQGLTDIRILNTIRNTKCGGGIQFAWIDEWFKRTWVTDPTDYIADSRILWQNIASAEQNFGLVSFGKTLQKDTLAQYSDSSQVKYISAEANYAYLELEIGLKNPLVTPNEIWIALDTYDKNAGESRLPTGESIPKRSEFAIEISNYAAKLFVTQAYDVFGIWHGISAPEQLFHSIPTDGAPWNIVRIKNNDPTSSVQYIGNLQVNTSFQPPSSKDAVVISDNKIHVRIPWSYLNVVAPNQMRVFNDNRATAVVEDTISDGFAFSVLYKHKWYYPANRYVWNSWNFVTRENVDEHLKTSYYVMKDQLHNFNTAAVAMRDSINFGAESNSFNVSKTEGLLVNDFDIDGDQLVALLLDNTQNGRLSLKNDGSFSYHPAYGFFGYDSLRYCVFDGYSLSKPNLAILHVPFSTYASDKPMNELTLNAFPTPTSTTLHIESPEKFSYIKVFDLNGKIMETLYVNTKSYALNVVNYADGEYIIIVKTNLGIISGRFEKG